MTHEYVAIVPARGGSKGLAQKNTRLLNGKPLYQYAVDQGARTTSGVIVSTDMQEILMSSQPEGVTLYDRPAEFAQDTSPMDDVLRDAIVANSLQGKVIVLLQVTSPLRTDLDVQAALEVFETGQFDLVQTVTLAECSVLKWGMRQGDQFVPLVTPEYCFQNRQSLPEVFKPNGAVYVFSADWFLENNGLATDKIGLSEMPANRSLDIDTLEDFDRVSEIMNSAKE